MKWHAVGIFSGLDVRDPARPPRLGLRRMWRFSFPYGGPCGHRPHPQTGAARSITYGRHHRKCRPHFGLPPFACSRPHWITISIFLLFRQQETPLAGALFSIGSLHQLRASIDVGQFHSTARSIEPSRKGASGSRMNSLRASHHPVKHREEARFIRGVIAGERLSPGEFQEPSGLTFPHP